MPLKNNVKRLLIHILSDFDSGEVADLMSKRVKVYWGKSISRGKEIFKSGMDNFVVEKPSVFYICESVL